MVKRSLFALVVFALILAACSPASATQAPQRSLSGSSSGSGGPVSAPAVPAAPPSEAQGGGPGVVTNSSNPYSSADKTISDNSGSAVDTGAPAQQQQIERLVIRNAEMTIVVADPVKAMDTITKLAADNGGFVVSSNSYNVSLDGGGQAPEGSITIRVKAESLDAVLQSIRKLVKNADEDVLSQTVTGQDVTKDYTDLQSRLKNLQQAEAQLREIMASATKPEDVLNVFNQLTQVREQIEVIQGQINYYQEAAALSSVAVQIKAEATVKPLTVAGWQPVGVARDALQATLNGLKTVANAAIWIVLFVLPIGVVIIAPIWLLILGLRWLIRRNRTRKPAIPPAGTPPATA